jgi:type III secretory pathway component EscT
MGLGLGLCLRLPITAVQSAGELMGHNTNAANLMSPGAMDTSGGTGWQGAYNWLGLLVWMGVGGPQAMVQALNGSVHLVPLGRVGLSLGGLGVAELAPLIVRTAGLAMVLCLPPVLASLLAQWGLGLVFRASARLQLYGFAMPLASLAAAGALALSLPTWPAILGKSLGWSLQAASGFAAGMGGR